MTSTIAAWDQDSLGICGSRSPPPHCPGCGRMGFYGPRKTDDDRRYRLCKFCGFYQEPDVEPTQCRATVHGCATWPVVAGAPYIWWVQPDENEYRCPQCGTLVSVAAA